MARNVRSSKVSAPANNQSLMIYGMIGIMLAVLVGSMYLFGIDLGFIHFGGTPNVNILYAGAIIAIIISYVVDVIYIKAIKKYFKHEDTYTSYIPYFNFSSTFGKQMQWGVWAIAAIIVLVALPAYTPVGQFMPSNYLILMAGKSIYIILIAMITYTVMRGYSALKFKTTVEKAYRKHISSGYGSGNAMSFVSYVIYFLPIIRMISLITDINFIKNTTQELSEMKRREG